MLIHFILPLAVSAIVVNASIPRISTCITRCIAKAGDGIQGCAGDLAPSNLQCFCLNPYFQVAAQNCLSVSCTVPEQAAATQLQRALCQRTSPASVSFGHPRATASGFSFATPSSIPRGFRFDTPSTRRLGFGTPSSAPSNFYNCTPSGIFCMNISSSAVRVSSAGSSTFNFEAPMVTAIGRTRARSGASSAPTTTLGQIILTEIGGSLLPSSFATAVPVPDLSGKLSCKPVTLRPLAAGVIGVIAPLLASVCIIYFLLKCKRRTKLTSPEDPNPSTPFVRGKTEHEPYKLTKAEVLEIPGSVSKHRIIDFPSEKCSSSVAANGSLNPINGAPNRESPMNLDSSSATGAANKENQVVP